MKINSYFIAFILFCFQLPSMADNQNVLKAYSADDKTEIHAGESGIFTIKIEIPYKHYIYGNPNGPGTGKPTVIEAAKLPGFIFESPKFPLPKKYTPKGEADFVWIYEKETEIDLPFRMKKDIAPGNYRLSVFVKALLCSDKACTPYDIQINHPVTVLAGTGRNGAVNTNSKFLPFTGSESESKINQSNIALTNDKNSDAKFVRETSQFRPRFTSSADISGIIQAIIYGIIAGFILNFMPCVLPVISIKILDIVKQSGNDRKTTMKTGLAFTAGILTSFAALAFLAAFLGYSWGGLFQNSFFLIIMTAIVFVLALSMFEVFIINVPEFAGRIAGSSSGSHINAYTKGLLATLLATPCSGPFLGGTLAWAFTQSYIVIFIVFLSVGFGMSLPYLILTANPGLMKFIPKPGEWMITFEKVMAFLLLGTCVYLIGILEQRLILPTLWFLFFTGIAFCQYGRYGSVLNSQKSRIISRLAAVFIIAAGYFLSYHYFFAIDENKVSFEISRNNFSISRLFENRNNGRITIVDFTADWCPNCKLVEKTSLFTEKVAEAISNSKAEFLTADLTKENPEASALLTKLGSRSIPFLAVFPAGENFLKPVCLRDIYSEKDVLNAIEEAK
ncbi:MAG: cytochrome c biogenesis protein CcdA [Spirochaetota bacterium]